MTTTYRIGEIAKHTGIEVETIRYYESIGLIPLPARSANGYRLYNEAQLHLIYFIKRCRLFDISIAEIKQLTQLLHNPEQGCHDVDQLIEKHLDHTVERMNELKDLQQSLMSLRAKCSQEVTVKNCGILQDLLQGDTLH